MCEKPYNPEIILRGNFTWKPSSQTSKMPEALSSVLRSTKLWGRGIWLLRLCWRLRRCFRIAIPEFGWKSFQLFIENDKAVKANIPVTKSVYEVIKVKNNNVYFHFSLHYLGYFSRRSFSLPSLPLLNLCEKKNIIYFYYSWLMAAQ